MDKPVVKTAALLMLGVFVASPSFAAKGAQAGAGTDTPAKPIVLSTPPAAVSLKKSLTADQQQALAALLDRFKGQLTDIANQLTGTTEPSALNKSSSSAAVAASTMPMDAAKAAFDQLKSVQAQIDRETASILSRTQLALHKKAMSATIGATDLAQAQVIASETSDHRKALTNSASALGADGSDPEAGAFVSSYCLAGAQYASWARYYAYYAYLSAYYNYVYYDSDSYAYYAYLYLDYAQSYALSAVQNLSAAYFDNTQLGSDFNGLGSFGASDAYNVQYYAYYGYLNAYNNYYYSGGSSYAYWAYRDGTSAYGYGYNAYVYGAYCH